MYMYFVNKYINKRKENQIIIYVKYLTITFVKMVYFVTMVIECDI